MFWRHGQPDRLVTSESHYDSPVHQSIESFHRSHLFSCLSILLFIRFFFVREKSTYSLYTGRSRETFDETLSI